jgi:uncharacterized protein YjbI with pentapeptide repeats
MSEDPERQKPTRTSPAGGAAGLRWGDPVSVERQLELEQWLGQWASATASERNARNGPFAGVVLTGADVFWLSARVVADQGTLASTHAEAEKLLRTISLEVLRPLPEERLHRLSEQELRSVTDQTPRYYEIDLSELHLEGAILRYADLTDAILTNAHLEEAKLDFAHLKRAACIGTHLERASLFSADFEDANLEWAHLERANLALVQLANTFFLDTVLTDAVFGGAGWRTTPTLAGIDWNQVPVLGDETLARSTLNPHSKQHKTSADWLEGYRDAVRANQALAVALQEQGLQEEAAHYAYRAQLLQQRVLWRRHAYGRYLFSRFLDGLAGYGYKPVRSLLVYVLAIAGFGALYYGVGAATGLHLAWYEALVVSLTAFHGRGFFAQQFSPGDPQALVAAVEAVVGLVVEVSLIATFTQRFLGSR